MLKFVIKLALDPDASRHTVVNDGWEHGVTCCRQQLQCVAAGILHKLTNPAKHPLLLHYDNTPGFMVMKKPTRLSSATVVPSVNRNCFLRSRMADRTQYTCAQRRVYAALLWLPPGPHGDAQQQKRDFG